jgi:hypothetical protein
MRVYRPVAWLVLLNLVPCMDTFPDANNYLARLGSPRNPVSYAVGF